MIRKAIIYLFGVCALVVLFVSVAGRIVTIDRGFQVFDSTERVARLHLDCTDDHVGFTAKWYHTETPGGEGEGWEIHDRVLTANYKVHRGMTQFAGGGKGIRDFKGSSQLEAEMPWWAAFTCSAILSFFFALEVVRSRQLKKRLAAQRAAEQKETESPAEVPAKPAEPTESESA